MDKLQREQMGTRFSGVNEPPLESGLLWKSQTLIVLWHQGVLHLASKVLPKSLIQICSRIAFGMDLRLYLGYMCLTQDIWLVICMYAFCH